MNDEQKCTSANEKLDAMVADYRRDMATWHSHSPHGPKYADAAIIARVLQGLIGAQPTMSAWLLAVAVQRLGDSA